MHAGFITLHASTDKMRVIIAVDSILTVEEQLNGHCSIYVKQVPGAIAVTVTESIGEINALIEQA